MVREELPAQQCPGHSAPGRVPSSGQDRLPGDSGTEAAIEGRNYCPQQLHSKLGTPGELNNHLTSPSPAPPQWEVTQSLGVPSPWLRGGVTL